jgi:hypothetical protein
VKIDFWIDPACPWCWQTSRWIVDIAPQRDIDINWMPISLLFKNNPPPESPFYDGSVKTRNMLRVIEAMRADGAAEQIGGLYKELGARIHHDGEIDFDIADALTVAGVDTKYAAAFDDESWDDVIRAGMDEGLALTGTDVGTPIIAFHGEAGRVGLFGPVISRIPDSIDKRLALWDAVVVMAETEGFWELKRTRTEGPVFGERP